MVNIENLVKTLRKMHDGGVMGPRITHIRFPHFKSIHKNERVDFTFPVTALVGQNGCGKSSVLHALYGAPWGKSTSDFWFATDIDPIVEGGGEINRFVYGHVLGDQVVETRKSRVSVGTKDRKPGYFEPTKAVAKDNMDRTPFTDGSELFPGKSSDRWNPVSRSVVYINFRSELNAFDQFFYFGKPKPTPTLKSIQDRLQRDAKRLVKVMDSGSSNTELRNQRVVFENRMLSKEELNATREILGKDYSEAQLVRHSLYGGASGLSVRFQVGGSRYSEAFAGSGESSVVSLVTHLIGAAEHSLVLLDEPEVSLHPGAQEKTLVFLMQQAKKRKLQVVFATHSPDLVRQLPPDAIKVFYPHRDGSFGVLARAHPYSAFQRLGSVPPRKCRILVEDRLAKATLEVAALRLTADERALLIVDYLPGGADTYLNYRIPTLMLSEENTFVMLDGDKKFTHEVPDPNEISVSEEGKLGETIKTLVGKRVNLLPDAGTDGEMERNIIPLQRSYIAFLRERVLFLPRLVPEEIVMSMIEDGYHCTTAKQAKNDLAKKTKEVLGKNSSSDIDQYAEVVLGTNREKSEDIKNIVATLRKVLERLR